VNEADALLPAYCGLPPYVTFTVYDPGSWFGVSVQLASPLASVVALHDWLPSVNTSVCAFTPVFVELSLSVALRVAESL
jgi:hypothetical protein